MKLSTAKKWIKIIITAAVIVLFLFSLLSHTPAGLVLLIICLALILAEAVIVIGFLRCPHCGGSLRFNMRIKYCPYCGKVLDEE